jgi:hypothetical protein
LPKAHALCVAAFRGFEYLGARLLFSPADLLDSLSDVVNVGRIGAGRQFRAVL